MKRKIIFMTRRMMMGGIESALIAKLEEIPKDKFDITLLIVHPGGELYDKIPTHVKVIHLFDNETRLTKRLWDFLCRGKVISVFRVLFNTFLLKRGVKSEFTEFIYYSKTRIPEDLEYDIAISYSGPLSLPVVYVAKNIKAKRKIAWIHSDLSDLAEKKYTKLVRSLRKYYKLYNHIFCVSNHATQEFREIFPGFKKDVSVFYNILDTEKIRQLSMKKESYNDSFSGTRILTVGRLGGEKGQDLIPGVLSRLLSDGYNIRWYCIGDGGTRSALEKMINMHQLKKYLILLGVKKNPYPFIADCDIYVQPSRHESYCLTVAEARILNKPIVTTNTGASEQIVHEQTGLIVEFDELQMYEAMKRLLDDQLLKKRFIKETSMENADTIDEMEKLYKIAEDIS